MWIYSHKIQISVFKINSTLVFIAVGGTLWHICLIISGGMSVQPERFPVITLEMFPASNLFWQVVPPKHTQSQILAA